MGYTNNIRSGERVAVVQRKRTTRAWVTPHAKFGVAIDGRKYRLGHASSFLRRRAPWYVSSEVSSVVPMSLDAHTTTGPPT